jgi:hypothetical protein
MFFYVGEEAHFPFFKHRYMSVNIKGSTFWQVRLDGIPSISQGCGFVIFGKCFFEAGGTEIPETVIAPLGLLWLQSLHKTHRKASPLLLIAAREGATDEQICLALWPGLPHLTDPASLQDSFDMDWEDMFRRRCEFADNAKGTVVYDNACNTVCFAEYRDARVFDEYASNLIYQKNIRVRALENSVYDTFTGSAHFMDWEDMFRRRCDFADNAKGTVVYDNACNTVCFAEYRDARVALKNSLYDTFTGSAHFE